MSMQKISNTCGNVFFEIDAASLKAAVELAVKRYTDLSRADLSGAELSCAELSCAELSCAELSCAMLRNAELEAEQ